MRKTLLFLLPLALIAVAAIYYKGKPVKEVFTVSSPSFGPSQPIPRQHSCEGSDTPIPLSWTHAPPKTQSLALIMEDPDAPHGTVIHWVAWNIDSYYP